METQYRTNPDNFRFYTLEQYIDLVIDFLEQLNPAIVIERFAGEVPPRFIASPNWGTIRYDVVLGKIEQRLSQRQTWQGRLYENRSV